MLCQYILINAAVVSMNSSWKLQLKPKKLALMHPVLIASARIPFRLSPGLVFSGVPRLVLVDAVLAPVLAIEAAAAKNNFVEEEVDVR